MHVPIPNCQLLLKLLNDGDRNDLTPASCLSPRMHVDSLLDCQAMLSDTVCADDLRRQGLMPQIPEEGTTATWLSRRRVVPNVFATPTVGYIHWDGDFGDKLGNQLETLFKGVRFYI